jgi:hypothetical protein
MIPKVTGTYWGISMTGGSAYTIAGTLSQAGNSGNNGLATNAKIYAPLAFVGDTGSNLYFTDSGANTIRAISRTTGNYLIGVTSLGVNIPTTANYIYGCVNVTGSSGRSVDGVSLANFNTNSLSGCAIDTAGNLLFVDLGNYRVVCGCQTTGTYYGVSMTANNGYTIIGSSSGTAGSFSNGASPLGNILGSISAIWVDTQNNIYLSDLTNDYVSVLSAVTATQWGVSMTARKMYKIAGTGTYNDTGSGGLAVNATFKHIQSIVQDGRGNICLADLTSSKIKVISAHTATCYKIPMKPNYIYDIVGITNIGNGTTPPTNYIIGTVMAMGSPITLAWNSSNNTLVYADTGTSLIGQILVE